MRIQDLVPFKIRRLLLKSYQARLWPRYFREYIRVIESGRMPDGNLIRKLVYAWGNQGFSAQINYIETCLEFAQKSKGVIFECGSGLSTLLLGVIGKYANRQVVSFEHLPVWADKVQKEINHYQLNYNTLYCKPVVPYGDFHWYDTAGVHVDGIGLCICDAPPGNTPGGRKGFLYLYKDKFLPNASILVDDTSRKAEQEMIREWQQVLKFSVEFRGSFDPHAILTLE